MEDTFPSSFVKICGEQIGLAVLVRIVGFKRGSSSKIIGSVAIVVVIAALSVLSPGDGQE